MHRAHLLAGLVLGLGLCPACAPRRPAPAVELQRGGALVPTALEFVPSGPANPRRPSIRLQPDGQMIINGKHAATMSADRVVDRRGKVLIVVGSDGIMTGAGVRPVVGFVGTDLAADDGSRILVQDDGTVVGLRGAERKILGTALPIGRARREALLLAYVFLCLVALRAEYDALVDEP